MPKPILTRETLVKKWFFREVSETYNPAKTLDALSQTGHVIVTVTPNNGYMGRAWLIVGYKEVPE